jgi:hypothetical protein
LLALDARAKLFVRYRPIVVHIHARHELVEDDVRAVETAPVQHFPELHLVELATLVAVAASKQIHQPHTASMDGVEETCEQTLARLAYRVSSHQYTCST